MAFQVKWYQTITSSLINYFVGVCSTITDFVGGSRIRTIFESVALEIEQVYYQVYLGIQDGIKNAIFDSFNFPPLSAQASSGLERFSRSTPAGVDYSIPAGTVVSTTASEIQPAVSFVTLEDAVLLTGNTFVDVLVMCEVSGIIGNVKANTIVNMTTAPAGVQTVSNPNSFNNGRDQETDDQRKTRFQEYINNLSRATLSALTYAAKQVPTVIDAIAIENPNCYCYAYDNSLAIFTDNSFEANLPSGIPFYGLPFPIGVNDCMYIGADSHFNSVRFDVSVGTVGNTVVWEYWNGSAWVSLPATDDTNYLATSGLLYYSIPANWVRTTVNGQIGFFIRMRVTVAAVSQVPKIFLVSLPPFQGTINVIAYDATLTCPTSLKTAIVAAEESYRASGIKVVVQAPVVTYIPITVTLYILPNSDAAAIKSATQQNISDYLNQFVLSQSLITAELIQFILNSNQYIYDVVINVPTDNYTVSSDEIVRAGTITVN